MRVMVTDGFFASFDDSNNIFTVPDKVPQVTLVAPENNNSEFTTSDAVTLESGGFDIEDSV
jgi:hypothetical protein